ncbi:biopolymer transporter ExbD [Thalassoglobus sp. JC818]|uniref:ExbD/TolR family protein n=1 Tax=Thalassoglobus sp. JC818 TaxID=3232136 RepID=UPI00345ABE22
MKIKHAKPTIVEADMTPMIDMTFQLIAFFMIVTNFEQTQADERVKLPADKLARPPKVARENDIVLNVGFDRNELGQKISEEPGIFYGDQPIPIRDYFPRLKDEYTLAAKQFGEAEARDRTIVIRADGDVPTGLIQELIKLGQEAGFEKFALKAKSDDEAG